LAAPQVFVNQRIFVYDIGEGPDAIINPEVLEADGEELGTEGCLSIPRLQGDVSRATRLVVTGLNRRGKRVRVEATDPYLARVFQHEIDHLNGVLFIDKAVEKSLHWLTDEQEGERLGEGRKRRRIIRPRPGISEPAAVTPE
jgi:peptide deformylase